MNIRKSSKRPLIPSPLIFGKPYCNFLGTHWRLRIKYILNINEILQYYFWIVSENSFVLVRAGFPKRATKASLLFPVPVTFCGILNHFLFQMSRWSDLQILNRLPFGRRFMHFIFYMSQIIFRLEVSGGLRPSRPSGHTWFWSPTPKPESQILTLPRSLSATISSWNCEI